MKTNYFSLENLYCGTANKLKECEKNEETIKKI